MGIAAFFTTVVFVIGYFLITVEHYTKINKAGVALFMAIASWSIQMMSGAISDTHETHFCVHIADVSQVIFFILGALVIVELISAHKGFQLIARAITVTSKRALLWVICSIAFILSGILDNLTTTIVMVVLLQKLMPRGNARFIIGSGIVIAANAGGAWTPIGDVTTTMLWIGEQLSTFKIMKELFLPSLGCFLISTGILTLSLKGTLDNTMKNPDEPLEPQGKWIFILGILSLIAVPVFKIVIGLPPFMGMLFSLSFLWLFTDCLHKNHPARQHLQVPHALKKIDLSGVFFFLGILLCVGALETSGILKSLGLYLDQVLPNLNAVAIAIGIFSAVVDNVPLVAASMSMYDLVRIPQDHEFWQLIAYTAGTGGSLLIIGSAAGVVFMSLEKVDFIWYAKKISFPALCGFFGGVAIFFLQKALFV